MNTVSRILHRIPPFWRKVLERVGWTALQATLGVVITVLAGITAPWAILIAAAASMLKGIAARHIGNKSEPSIP